MESGNRKVLLQFLVEHSYRFSPEPFDLSSGRQSNHYVDCKQTTMRRQAARAIAELFEEHIPNGVSAVGGLTAGADPIAYAIRDFADRDLDAFMVRKAAKQHGLRKLVEGPVKAGDKVVVVDDVVTTGKSTIEAIKACQGEGLDVVAVVVLVDREEDGGIERIREAFNSAGPVASIFTLSELQAVAMESERAHEQDADSGQPRPAVC